MERKKNVKDDTKESEKETFEIGNWYWEFWFILFVLYLIKKNGRDLNHNNRKWEWKEVSISMCLCRVIIL